MRWQTTAVLAVLLVALGAFYYVWEIRLGPEREKAETRKGRLFTAEPADVTEVELTRGDQVVRLKREGDAWQVLEPVKARGDRGPIEETLTNVLTAKMDREIAAAPASLGEFGLEKPAARLTLTLKDGKRLGLALGAKSPTGAWVYAREPDKKAVVALPDSVLTSATRPVAEFRDKTILSVDRKDVTGIDIALRDDTISTQAADGKWKIVRPVALPADSDTLNEFLDKLASSRVKEFVTDTPASLASYGLERPVTVSIHTGRDKDRATKALVLGRVDTEKKGVYAMRPGESTVLLLPEEVWTALPKNVAAVRDKTVVTFERDKVDRLDVDSPHGTVTLAREGDRWTITAPEALPADQTEVGAVLFKLHDLKAQAFLTEDASGIARYLSRPTVRVTLTRGGAATTVWLAPSPERRGGQPTAYAAVAGRGPVVLVDGKALDEVGRSLTDLRDRTLLSGLDPKDVKRVQLRAGGKTITLERSGETDWKVTAPTKGSARPGKVDDLLYTLRGLKWKEMVAPAGGDAGRYGFDAPTLEVTLFRSGGAEIGTLTLGKRDGERVFARTKVSPTVYAVEQKQLGELPKSAEDLRA